MDPVTSNVVTAARSWNGERVSGYSHTVTNITGVNLFDVDNNRIGSVTIRNMYNNMGMSAIKVDVGGNIFVAHSTKENTVANTTMTDEEQTIVEKYNSALESQWRVYVGGASADGIAEFLPDDNGGIFLHKTVSYDGVKEQFIHITSDGSNIDLEKRFSIVGSSLYFHHTRLERIVLLKSENRIVTAIHPFNTANLILVEVDISTNEIIWQNSKANRTARLLSIVKDSADDIYVASKDTSDTKIVITKYSSTGQIRWARILNKSFNASGTIENERGMQGKIFIDEYDNVWFVTYNNVDSNLATGIFLYCVNKQGNLIESKSISIIGFVDLYLKGDEIIVVYYGSITVGSPFETKILRVHRNSNGPLDNGIVISNRSIEEEQWDVFPDGSDGQTINDISSFWGTEPQFPNDIVYTENVTPYPSTISWFVTNDHRTDSVLTDGIVIPTEVPISIEPSPYRNHYVTTNQNTVANNESTSTILTGILGFYQSAALQKGTDMFSSNVVMVTAPWGSGIQELRSIDYYGDLIEEKYYTKSGHQVSPAIHTDAGGNVFVMYGNGTSINVVGANIGGQQSDIIEKYNPSLELEWQLITGTLGTDFYDRIVPDEAGGVLLLINGGYLVGIDADGDKQWERQLQGMDTVYYARSVTAQPLDITEGKLLIGFTYITGAPTYATTESYITAVQLFPYNGETNDTVLWADHRTNRTGSSIIQMPNGELLHTATDRVGTNSNGPTVFTKYTATGEIIWSKRWKPEGTSDFNSSSASLLVADDGNIWILNYDRVPQSGYTYPKGLFLTKVDNDGNLLYSRLIRIIANEQSDEQIIVSGLMHDGKDIIITVMHKWYSKGGSVDSRPLKSEIIRVPAQGEMTYGNTNITITDRSTDLDIWEDYANGTAGATMLTPAEFQNFWNVSSQSQTDNVDVVHTDVAVYNENGDTVDQLYSPNYNYTTSNVWVKGLFNVTGC
jgi:hypothetical protein